MWSCREVIRYRMHLSQDTQSIGENDFVACFSGFRGHGTETSALARTARDLAVGYSVSIVYRFLEVRVVALLVQDAEGKVCF